MLFMVFLTYGVNGVVGLVSHFEYIEMEDDTMCFDEAQDATAA